jgi:hypothetical protein
MESTPQGSAPRARVRRGFVRPASTRSDPYEGKLSFCRTSAFWICVRRSRHLSPPLRTALRKFCSPSAPRMSSPTGDGCRCTLRDLQQNVPLPARRLHRPPHRATVRLRNSHRMRNGGGEVSVTSLRYPALSRPFPRTVVIAPMPTPGARRRSLRNRVGAAIVSSTG